MTAGPMTSGGQTTDAAHRLGRVFLWIALLLAIPVGRLHDLVNAEALLFGYVAFVVLFTVTV